MSHVMAVLVKKSEYQQQSESLAQSLKLPIIHLAEETFYSFGLFYEAGMLKLHQSSTSVTGSVWVDFGSAKSAYRQKHQGKGKLPISRACGIKQNHRPTIIDATSGLAQDAFILAGLGCQVLCIEQQPVLAALLADGFSRAVNAEPWVQDIIARMQLHQAQAESILGDTAADVVYLDPMYPQQQNRKQAKVKKGMQLFRALPGTSCDEHTLLSAALTAAIDRVVVKRPVWAGFIAGLKPTYQVPGKNHRFDIYKVEGV